MCFSKLKDTSIKDYASRFVLLLCLIGFELKNNLRLSVQQGRRVAGKEEDKMERAHARDELF